MQVLNVFPLILIDMYKQYFGTQKRLHRGIICEASVPVRSSLICSLCGRSGRGCTVEQARAVDLFDEEDPPVPSQGAVTNIPLSCLPSTNSMTFKTGFFHPYCGNKRNRLPETLSLG